MTEDRDDRVEVATVRPGEDLDWANLESYLRQHVPGLYGDFAVSSSPTARPT